MISYADCTLPDLQTQLAAWGCKPSHARRLLQGYYARAGTIDWSS